MVGAVGLPRIAFIQLVEIDNFRAAIRKAYITQGGDAVPFPVFQVLDQPVAKEEAQVLCVIGGKLPLFFREGEYLVGKIIFPIVGNGMREPALCLKLQSNT